MRRDESEVLLNWGDHPTPCLSENLTVPGPAPSWSGNDADRLRALGTLLLQLHQGARDWSATQLLERTFELLALQLPFDGVRFASTEDGARAQRDEGAERDE